MALPGFVKAHIHVYVTTMRGQLRRPSDRSASNSCRRSSGIRQQGQEARVRMGMAWRLPRNRDAASWAMRQRLPVQTHVSGEAQAMFGVLIERDYLDPH